MDTMEFLDRIESDPEVMLGKPVIRDTRISVEIPLETLSAGATVEGLFADYARVCTLALAYAREAVGLDEVAVDTARGDCSDHPCTRISRPQPGTITL